MAQKTDPIIRGIIVQVTILANRNHSPFILKITLAKGYVCFLNRILPYSLISTLLCPFDMSGFLPSSHFWSQEVTDRSFPPIIPYAEYVLARLDFQKTLGKEHSKASKAKIPHVDNKTLLPLVSKHSKHGDSLGKIRDMVSVPHTCAIHWLVAHSVFGRSYAFPGG